MDLDVMIAEVQAALHALQMGRHAVKVTIEGQETEFNRVSIPQLKGYLAELQARKAALQVRGAVGIMF